MIDRRNDQSRRSQTTRRVVDRRDGERIPAKASIRFMRSGKSGEEILHGELQDASTHGLRISFTESLQVGEALLIEFKSDDGDCLNTTARVVRVDENEGGRYNVGCEFRMALTRRQVETLKRIAQSTPEKTDSVNRPC